MNDLELDMDALMNVFRDESRELLDGIDAQRRRLEAGTAQDGAAALREMVRMFHTLAGACGSISFETASRLARAFERQLKPMRDQGTLPSSALLALISEASGELRELIADVQRPADRTVAIEQRLAATPG